MADRAVITPVGSKRHLVLTVCGNHRATLCGGGASTENASSDRSRVASRDTPEQTGSNEVDAGVGAPGRPRRLTVTVWLGQPAAGIVFDGGFA